jgi:hypothetical protein
MAKVLIVKNLSIRLFIFTDVSTHQQINHIK